MSLRPNSSETGGVVPEQLAAEAAMKVEDGRVGGRGSVDVLVGQHAVVRVIDRVVQHGLVQTDLGQTGTT